MSKRTNSQPNGPCAPWKARAKAAKHERALAMQVEYNKLTTEQKLAKLDAGNFTATKQRARLNAKLTSEKA